MPVLHQLQPSFNNGEISPLLYDRVDFQKFVSSVKTGKNMFVHPQGGMSNRAGTVMLAAAKDAKVRLIPFEFSSNETYVIEFGNGYCRFFTSEGQVVVEEEVDGETVQVPYEIQSPFATADLDKIRYCQSGDVMYIAWGGKPKVLSRFGHTNWSFSNYDYKNGPFAAENVNPNNHIAVRYVAEDGNYKVTSDFDSFSENSVGQLFYVVRSFNAGHISGTATTSSFESGNALCNGVYTFRTSGTWTGTVKIEYSKDMVSWKSAREFTSANDYNVDFSGSLLDGSWWVRISASITSGSVTFSFDTQSFSERCIFEIISYTSAREVRAQYTGDIVGFENVFVDTASGDVVDIIPVMTSNTTPSGTASGSGTLPNDEWWRAFADIPTFQSGNPYLNSVSVGKGISGTLSYSVASGSSFYFQKMTFYAFYEYNLVSEAPDSLNEIFPAFAIKYSLNNGTLSNAAFTSTLVEQIRWPNHSNRYAKISKFELSFSQPFLADKIQLEFTGRDESLPNVPWSYWVCHLGEIKATGFQYDSDSGAGASSAENSFAFGLWEENVSNPTDVDLYQDRIVWSTNNQLDATKISDYKNFGVSNDVTEDDAISVIIKDKKVDKINSIVAGQKLAVYSDDGNFVHNNDTFTPNSATFLKQGATGGSNVKPVVVRDHIIYAHPMKQAVSDYAYNFETDGYAGQDITLLANHLFDGKVIKMLAYQQEPYSIIWVLQEEGNVLACTYLRQQNVIAWTPMDFGGKVLSLTVCSKGTTEELYLAVERTNGTFVEKMPVRLLSVDPKECFFVDCGRTYRGEPATIISGLDYLEGEDVVALADGNVIKDLTVENGSITLPIPASIVTVGLPYESVLETLTFDANTGDGSNLNRKKRVVAVSIRYNASRGSKLSVNGHKEVDMLRREQEGYNIPIALKSGVYREIIASTHDERTTIKIRQDEPLPITVVSIIPEIEYER